MKRIILSALALAAMLMAAPSWARNISADEAKDAAVHYMQHNSDLGRFDASQYSLAFQWNNDELNIPSMYLFTTPGNGWIIMAATTAMDPVVAFSDDSQFDPDNVPAQAAWWLEQYNEVVCGVQAADQGRGLADSRRWTVLENHELKGNTKDDRIIHTMVRWEQGDDDGKRYNSLCPKVGVGNGDSIYTVTGCVATALSQLCYYYKYPRKGTGYTGYQTYDLKLFLQQRLDDSTVFNYDVMPDRLTNGSSDSAKYEVARLCYSVGVAVHMNYNTTHAGGSGANSQMAVNAMATNFKYTKGSIVSRGYVSEASYMEQIRQLLSDGNVVYMHGASPGSEGNDAGGHAWLVTGYRIDNESQYYMNWGWGGGGNGFFNLGDNDMAISGFGYNFYQSQGYIKGMTPPADSILAVNHVDLEAELGAAYPNPATVSVQLPYTTTVAADLQVYGMDGRQVCSRRVQPGSGEVRLDVSAMPAGIYIYRIGTANGKFIVR